jgi:hypothetical protein
MKNSVKNCSKASIIYFTSLPDFEIKLMAWMKPFEIIEQFKQYVQTVFIQSFIQNTFISLLKFTVFEFERLFCK